MWRFINFNREHSGTFCIYADLNALLIWIVWRFAPETKGRTLEEIEQFWKARES